MASKLVCIHKFDSKHSIPIPTTKFQQAGTIMVYITTGSRSFPSFLFYKLLDQVLLYNNVYQLFPSIDDFISWCLLTGIFSLQDLYCENSSTGHQTSCFAEQESADWSIRATKTVVHFPFSLLRFAAIEEGICIMQYLNLVGPN